MRIENNINKISHNSRLNKNFKAQTPVFDTQKPKELAYPAANSLKAYMPPESLTVLSTENIVKKLKDLDFENVVLLSPEDLQSDLNNPDSGYEARKLVSELFECVNNDYLMFFLPSIIYNVTANKSAKIQTEMMNFAKANCPDLIAESVDSVTNEESLNVKKAVINSVKKQNDKEISENLGTYIKTVDTSAQLKMFNKLLSDEDFKEILKDTRSAINVFKSIKSEEGFEVKAKVLDLIKFSKKLQKVLDTEEKAKIVSLTETQESVEAKEQLIKLLDEKDFDLSKYNGSVRELVSHTSKKDFLQTVNRILSDPELYSNANVTKSLPFYRINNDAANDILDKKSLYDSMFIFNYNFFANNNARNLAKEIFFGEKEYSSEEQSKILKLLHFARDEKSTKDVKELVDKKIYNDEKLWNIAEKWMENCSNDEKKKLVVKMLNSDILMEQLKDKYNIGNLLYSVEEDEAVKAVSSIIDSYLANSDIYNHPDWQEALRGILYHARTETSAKLVEKIFENHELFEKKDDFKMDVLVFVGFANREKNEDCETDYTNVQCEIIDKVVKKIKEDKDLPDYSEKMLVDSVGFVKDKTFLPIFNKILENDKLLKNKGFIQNSADVFDVFKVSPKDMEKFLDFYLKTPELQNDDERFQRNIKYLAKSIPANSSLYKYTDDKDFMEKLANGLRRPIMDSEVILFCDLYKYEKKKSIDNLTKKEKKEFAMKLMDNKNTLSFLSAEFRKMCQIAPIGDKEYTQTIKKLSKMLNISQGRASENEIKEFNTVLSRLIKGDYPRICLDYLVDIVKKDKSAIQNTLPTLERVLANPKFKELNESDKRVLILATVLKNIDTESNDDTESAFEAYMVTKKFNLTDEEAQKIYNLIETSNLPEKIKNAGHKQTQVPKSFITGDSMTDMFDLMAFKLKEGNNAELSEILFCAKSKESPKSRFYNLLQKRIQKMKSQDFILPQTDPSVYNKQAHEEHFIIGDNTYKVKIVRASEIKDFYAFIHTPESGFSTGGSRRANFANFELFKLLNNDKIICTSYIANGKTGGFEIRDGFILDVANDKQYVGSGKDIYSASKNIPDMIVEYYRNKGEPENNSFPEYKYRIEISEKLKDLLFADDADKDTKYIQRLDNIKSQLNGKTMTFERLEKIDKEFAQAYRKFMETGDLLNDVTYNEVLVSNPKISAIYTKDLYELPEEYWKKAQEENLPIVVL